MATTTDSSVLLNLKDLFVMEADRRVAAVTAEAEAKLAAAAQLEVERKAREEALRAARADERQAAEAERASRDLELEARIQALKAQLTDVQVAREGLRHRIEQGSLPAAAPSRAGTWLAGAMAALALVASLGATAAAWPRHEERVALAPTTIVDTVREAPVADAPEVPVVAAVEVDAPSEPDVQEPPRRRIPVTRIGRPVRPVQDDLTRDLAFDDGEHEVLSDDFLRGAGR